MTGAARSHALAGFTAVELMMVMGIMLIIMSITVPTVLPALRHGKLLNAFNDIDSCWRQARGLAMNSSVPNGTRPYHYGIVISQVGSASPYVALVYDNETVSGITPPKLLMQGEDPLNPTTTYSAGASPVAQYTFNGNVVFAISGVTGTPVTTGNQVIAIYAQYGTGLPLNPVDVAAGRGLVATPTSLGVSGLLATASGAPTPTTIPPSVMAITELMTTDFVSSPRRGYCIAFGIYHAGFLAENDL